MSKLKDTPRPFTISTLLISSSRIVISQKLEDVRSNSSMFKILLNPKNEIITAFSKVINHIEKKAEERSSKYQCVL